VSDGMDYSLYLAAQSCGPAALVVSCLQTLAAEPGPEMVMESTLLETSTTSKAAPCSALRSSLVSRLSSLSP